MIKRTLKTQRYIVHICDRHYTLPNIKARLAVYLWYNEIEQKLRIPNCTYTVDWTTI